MINQYGKVEVAEFEVVDKKARLWTIQDAKDGDVLNSTRVQATIIFKGFAEDGKHINAYCALQSGIFIHQEILWDRDFEPASENWKNAIFDAMKEAGYEWDAENRELKKIVHKELTDFQEIFRSILIESNGKYDDNTVIRLSGQVLELVEQKSAWSEEDEKERKRVVGLLEGWLSTFKETCYAEDCKCGIEWLKSIKEKVQPQSTWKPSDEQLFALRIAIGDEQGSDCCDILRSLLKDLKSL